jgi:hypothetical protein
VIKKVQTLSWINYKLPHIGNRNTQNPDAEEKDLPLLDVVLVHPLDN